MTKPGVTAERARKRILIVEDEADLSASLRYNLEKDGGYSVTVADDGERGLALARQRTFDLIILDLMLPGMDGLEVCRALRGAAEGPMVPIIMLTARVDETDKLVGLEMGADDYMTKPFSMKEVLARVRAHLRRAGPVAGPAPQRVLTCGGMRIDLDGYRVWVGRSEISLTRMEFSLLAALARNRGRVLTRDHLLETVWGYEYYGGTRTVDVHVRRLRKKLGAEGDRIETVFGVGYRFREALDSAGDD